ncbi:MAG: hypothetical protein SCM88_14465, partial [Bacillota bacterium]|nr:hypothetical protein [Bacillota bacterium]
MQPKYRPLTQGDGSGCVFLEWLQSHKAGYKAGQPMLTRINEFAIMQLKYSSKFYLWGIIWMSKKDKLLEKLCSNPMPTDFTYLELTKLMGSLVYHEVNKGRDHQTKAVLQLHKPHPGNELKQYQVKEVVRFLRKHGEIK